MIKLSKGIPFKLPRVGSDVFAKLMRAKLKYDRKKGMFEITDNTNLQLVLSILNAALNDEVILELQCILCSKSAGCSECEYADICDRSNVSSLCICKECLNKPDAYEQYKEVLLQRLKFDKKIK
jgi:hypothetical protein